MIISGDACIVPEGRFYFSFPEEKYLQKIMKRINGRICGQTTKKCRSSPENVISEGGIFTFKVTKQGKDPKTNVHKSWIIKPTSYLYVDDQGFISPAITVDKKLFQERGQHNQDGRCSKADFAVGSLFLFETRAAFAALHQ